VWKGKHAEAMNESYMCGVENSSQDLFSCLFCIQFQTPLV